MAPPVFTESTLAARPAITKKTGEILRLTCEALGKPEPDVWWLQDGRRLRSRLTPTSSSRRKGRNVLAIENLILEDSGVYTCVAENKLGRAERNFTLKVEESPQHPHLPRGPNNTTVEEGMSAVLECEVRSPTQPTIKWLRKLEEQDLGALGAEEKAEVFDLGEASKFRVLDASENIDKGEDLYLNRLAIEDASEVDAGVYICFVTNAIGFKYKSSFVNVIPSEFNSHF